MAKPLVDDDLRELIESLLPPPKPRRKRYSGRKPVDSRKSLSGILFVLTSGIPWEMLPQEMGCGSGPSEEGLASSSRVARGRRVTETS